MSINIRTICGALMSALLLFWTADAQIATGGTYTLDQSVIATGGGTSSDVGNTYRVEGTSGQAVAGTQSSAGNYSVRGGFWAANPLAPTAASAFIGGQVVGMNGGGLNNVIVTLSGGSLITPRRTRTNTFGTFSFEDVEVGQVYTLTVEHKKYGFAQNSQVFSFLESVKDITFHAAWEF